LFIDEILLRNTIWKKRKKQKQRNHFLAQKSHKDGGRWDQNQSALEVGLLFLLLYQSNYWMISSPSGVIGPPKQVWATSMTQRRRRKEKKKLNLKNMRTTGNLG